MPPPIRKATRTRTIVSSIPNDIRRGAIDLSSSSTVKSVVGIGEGGGAKDGVVGGYFVDSVSFMSICFPYRVPWPDLFNLSAYVHIVLWSPSLWSTTSGASLDFRNGRSMALSALRDRRNANPGEVHRGIETSAPDVRKHIWSELEKRWERREHASNILSNHRAGSDPTTNAGCEFASHLAWGAVDAFSIIFWLNLEDLILTALTAVALLSSYDGPTG
jgi:hypothetical protein